MKILWVTASPIGPASRILGVKYQGASGVWIQNIYEQIKQKSDFELSFLCFSKALKKNEIIHKTAKEGQAYCLNMPALPFGRPASDALKMNVQSVIGQINPDIIHIWGTETTVQNVVAQCAPKIPKVTFLQGLIGIHGRYRGGYLKNSGYSIPYNLKQRLIQKVRSYYFNRQADYEARQLKLCGNVIADSEFSASYCHSISDEIKVYNYKLLPGNIFFEKKWRYNPDIPHTVFTVFGHNADKGLHQVLRALKIVKRTFPDVRLTVPGPFNIDNAGHLKAENSLTPYEKLLSALIEKFDLFDNISFCGKLSQEQMAVMMAESTVFVNPSIMEVHAGSLREAMAFGMPCISTYCGSVGEFVTEGQNGFMYRFEEFEVLAKKIIRLLSDRQLLISAGKNAADTILEMRNKNNSITDIYTDMLK